MKNPFKTPMLFFAMLLALLTFGCGCAAGSSGEGDGSGEVVKRGTALALSAVTEAVKLLDRREAEYLDSLEKPTPDQIAASTKRVERIERAMAGIRLARSWLDGNASEANGMKALRDAVKAVRIVVDELKADGAKVPPEVEAGLILAEARL